MYKFFKHDAHCPRNIACITICTPDFFQIMHATNERFRIFASYRILFLHTFQCGTRYRDCVTNSTRNIVKSTNVLVREKQQGRGGSSLCRMLRDENANSRRIRVCMRVCVLYARASRGYSTNEWYGSKHDLQWFAKHREQPSIKHPEIGYSCPPSRLYVIVGLDGWMHVWYTVYADRSRTLFYSPRIHKRANKTNTYFDVRVRVEGSSKFAAARSIWRSFAVCAVAHDFYNANWGRAQNINIYNVV